MRILSFNANGLRSAARKGFFDWFAGQNVDVMCLQETKVQDHDFPVQPFIDAGYQIAYRGEKSYNGVALASMVKPAEIKFGFDDFPPYDESRLITAKIGNINVVNTYVPQGREI